MSGASLRYYGVAVGSDESFSVSSMSEKEDFSQPADILKSSSAFANFGNACDLYSVSLDGRVFPIPADALDVQDIGIWSVQQSTKNGMFSSPITITMTAAELFSTAGITLFFDKHKGIFATHLLIKWYRNNTLVSEKEFFPDSAEFFCTNRVEFYNRVDITFYSLNVPQNRLWLQKVSFGVVVEFTSRNLKNSKINQSISPIAESLPISTLNFSLFSNEGIDFVFQKKQAIDAFFDGKLKGRFFIKEATQSGEGFYTANCEDYIGHLESAMFNGGLYDMQQAGYLINQICKIANVPVVYPPELDSAYVLTGYIPRCTCRKALQQVLFALQLVADTSNAQSLILRYLDDEIMQSIPRSRIMQGINVKETDKVSEVRLVAHAYTVSEERKVLYDAKESGAGDNIEVVFSEPHSQLILSGESIHIIEWSVNHAIISVDETAVLTGRPILHSTFVKSRKNELLTGTDETNVLEIKDATLINSRNVDTVLDKCYDYLVKSKTISAKIVEGKHESDNGYVYDKAVSLGDKLSLVSPFTSELVGVLEKQSYSMNGGILIKECSLR